MTKKERYSAVIKWFEENRQIAETELIYNDPFSLLVAVILSAQCTDKRVNMITPKLMADFPTPKAMSNTTSEVIFDYIKSISYPNNKSKHLVGMAKKLVSDFNSELPQSVEKLQTLPGVGRKTANVIVSVLYNMPAMAVDTHVFRVSNRIGLTLKSKNPIQTEKELVRNIPSELLAKAHHWLILHGRYVCIARKPKCDECGLQKWCDFFTKQNG